MPKKIVSLLLLPIFIFSNIAYAGNQPGAATSKVAHEEIVTNPDKIAIPKDTGLIKSKFTGNSGRMVIHIQDAHCNYEAQTNIASIIENLVRNYNLSLVSVEGADGFIDTSWFRAFPDDEVRKEVATYFMKKGEITGPEFLSITTDYPIKLFGAETRSYYIQNLNAFTESYQYKEDIEKYFNNLKGVIDKLKGYIYNAELKTLDEKMHEYEAKKIEFNEYVRFLEATAARHKINIRLYDDFFKLISVLIYEKKIDFGFTDKERGALIDELSKSMSKEDLTELVAQSLAFKVGKITAVDYYSYLKKLTVANDIDITKKYPNLANYIIYNAVYSRIDNEKLFHNIREIETAIKEKTFKTDDQRALEKLSRHIDILIGLVNIKLLNGDFEYYKANKDEFSHEFFSDFLSKKAIQYGLLYDVEPPGDEISASIPKLEDFYAIAMKRDKALVDNTLEAMKKEKQKIAVLVTGGFHSEGITKLLEKEGVSYMVVCPSITKDVPSPYIQILTNQRTPFEEILVGQPDSATKQGMLSPIPINSIAGLNYQEIKTLYKGLKDIDRLIGRKTDVENDSLRLALELWIGKMLPLVRKGIVGRDKKQAILREAYEDAVKLGLEELVKNEEITKARAGVLERAMLVSYKSILDHEFEKAFSTVWFGRPDEERPLMVRPTPVTRIRPITEPERTINTLESYLNIRFSKELKQAMHDYIEVFNELQAVNARLSQMRLRPSKFTMTLKELNERFVAERGPFSTAGTGYGWITSLIESEALIRDDGVVLKLEIVPPSHPELEGNVAIYHYPGHIIFFSEEASLADLWLMISHEVAHLTKTELDARKVDVELLRYMYSLAATAEEAENMPVIDQTIKDELDYFANSLLRQALNYELDIHTARLWLDESGRFFLTTYGLGRFEHANIEYIRATAESLSCTLPREPDERLLNNLRRIISDPEQGIEDKIKIIRVRFGLNLAKILRENITNEIRAYQLDRVRRGALSRDEAVASRAIDELEKMAATTLRRDTTDEFEKLVGVINEVIEKSDSFQITSMAKLLLFELMSNYGRMLEERYNFNASVYAKRRNAYAEGELSIESCRIPARDIEKYEKEDLEGVLLSSRFEDEEIGKVTIRNNELAVLALNGGIATRFRGTGHGVKGLFQILELEGLERTFMEAKLRHTLWAERHYGGTIPQVILDSYYTDNATRNYLADNEYFGMSADNVLIYNAGISRRIIPTKRDLDAQYRAAVANGKITREVFERWQRFIDGTESNEFSHHEWVNFVKNERQRDVAFNAPDWLENFNPTGHFEAVRQLVLSGTLYQLIKRGVKYIWVSNIDNLGATIEPAELGHFVKSGKKILVEVGAKYSWDAGGAPAKVRDASGQFHMRMVEQQYFDPAFDQSQLPDFNTGTFILTVDGILEVCGLTREKYQELIESNDTNSLIDIVEKAAGEIPIYPVIKEVAAKGTMIQSGDAVEEKVPVVQFEQMIQDSMLRLPDKDKAFFPVVREERFFPIKSLDDLNKGRGYTLRFSSERASDANQAVYVMGTFNNWQPSDNFRMKPEIISPDGRVAVWKLDISLGPAKYAFKYMIGDEYIEPVRDQYNQWNIVTESGGIRNFEIEVKTVRERLVAILADKTDVSNNVGAAERRTAGREERRSASGIAIAPHAFREGEEYAQGKVYYKPLARFAKFGTAGVRWLVEGILEKIRVRSPRDYERLISNGYTQEDFIMPNIGLIAKAIALYNLAKARGDYETVVGTTEDFEERLEEKGLLVVYDNRPGNEEFAKEIARILVAYGIKATLAKSEERYMPTPIPAMSLLVKNEDYAGAIILTASHNGDEWNGIKFNAEDGAPAEPKVTNVIGGILKEELSQETLSYNAALQTVEELMAVKRPGREDHWIETIDSAQYYVEKTLNYIGETRARELKRAIREGRIIMLYSAFYGSSSEAMRRLFKEFGIPQENLIEAEKPTTDTYVASYEPTLKKLKELGRRAKETAEKAIREGKRPIILACAADNDADRFQVSVYNYETGELEEFRPDRLTPVLGHYLVVSRGWSNPKFAWGRSFVSSSYQDYVAQLFGQKTIEPPTGFKYAPRALAEPPAGKSGIIYSEESYGLSFKDWTLDKDGILPGLLALELMANLNMTLREYDEYVRTELKSRGLRSDFNFDRLDMKLPGEVKERAVELFTDFFNGIISGQTEFAGQKISQVYNPADFEGGMKFVTESGAWVALRTSGTEPVIRIYTEGNTEAERESLEVEAVKLTETTEYAGAARESASGSVYDDGEEPATVSDKIKEEAANVVEEPLMIATSGRGAMVKAEDLLAELITAGEHKNEFIKTIVKEATSLQRTLLKIGFYGNKKKVVLFADTALNPAARNALQAGESKINSYLDNSLIEVRDTGKGAIDSLRQAMAKARRELKEGEELIVISLAGNETLAALTPEEQKELGKILNIQTKNTDGEELYIPIIGLYDAVLRIAYDMPLDNIRQCLAGIAKFNPQELEEFLKKDGNVWTIRLEPIQPIDTNEILNVYNAVQKVLTAL